jgi:hypothetical protein
MPKPTFIPPMLATLVGAAFDDPDWLFEVIRRSRVRPADYSAPSPNTARTSAMSYS